MLRKDLLFRLITSEIIAIVLPYPIIDEKKLVDWLFISAYYKRHIFSDREFSEKQAIRIVIDEITDCYIAMVSCMVFGTAWAATIIVMCGAAQLA